MNGQALPIGGGCMYHTCRLKWLIPSSKSVSACQKMHRETPYYFAITVTSKLSYYMNPFLINPFA